MSYLDVLEVVCWFSLLIALILVAGHYKPTSFIGEFVAGLPIGRRVQSGFVLFAGLLFMLFYGLTWLNGVETWGGQIRSNAVEAESGRIVGRRRRRSGGVAGLVFIGFAVFCLGIRELWGSDETAKRE